MIAPWTPCVGALGDRAAGTDGGRRDDDRQVDRVGDGGQARVGLDAEDAGALGVDRADGAAERAADQVPEHVRPTLPSFSVAPMTATDAGRKIASSGLRAAPRTSLARSDQIVRRNMASTTPAWLLLLQVGVSSRPGRRRGLSVRHGGGTLGEDAKRMLRPCSGWPSVTATTSTSRARWRPSSRSATPVSRARRRRPGS